ncbi:type II toxin-antitoxin system PemK/MazF family toxin [bacterium]|nr:type II toxin-antitoxin system PemK/MazF family toxin [bacterium]
MGDGVASRGEVWMADLEPVRGHEQGGRRPALVISSDRLNHSRAEIVVVVPLTTKLFNLATHVPLNPPEGGVTRPSHIKCEDLRSLSAERLGERLGRVDAGTMAAVEHRLRLLLALEP